MTDPLTRLACHRVRGPLVSLLSLSLSHTTHSHTHTHTHTYTHIHTHTHTRYFTLLYVHPPNTTRFGNIRRVAARHSCARDHLLLRRPLRACSQTLNAQIDLGLSTAKADRAKLTGHQKGWEKQQQAQSLMLRDILKPYRG